MPEKELSNTYKTCCKMTIFAITVITLILVLSAVLTWYFNNFIIAVTGLPLFTQAQYFDCMRAIGTILFVTLYTPLICIAAGYYRRYRKTK